MSFKKLFYLIRSDLYRYHGNCYSGYFLKELVWGTGFRYSFWMRICCYLREKSILFFPLYIFSRLLLRRYEIKFGISIPCKTKIESGFYIGHFGQIVVHGKTKIGKNLNISQGVAIGVSNRGKHQGVPTIGDNVYIGPGAKIFGNIKIGNNVAIGANSVVTKDVPDNAVVIGAPGRVVSYKGSEGYILYTDYDRILKGPSN